MTQRIVFRPDPELRDALAGAIVKRMSRGDLKQGDTLITLMAVAREIIERGHLPRDARFLVLRDCVDRLCGRTEGPGHMVPQ